MEKAYKGLRGSYSILNEDDQRHSCTHIVLTVNEYNKLKEDEKSLKSKLAAEKADHKKEVDELTTWAIEQKEKAEKAAQEVEKARQQVAVAEAERDKQTNLNINLLRVNRERANAKRGIQPKKKHSGYRYDGKIMETRISYGYDKQKRPTYANVWTTILETPYDGTIPIHEIEDEIFKDLMRKDGILEKLDIACRVCEDNQKKIKKGTYAEAIANIDDAKNYLYDYKFMINTNSRFWEIQIITTKAIKALAEMMG